MTTATGQTHPLIARLLEIADGEYTSRKATDIAVMEAEHTLELARQAQRVAAERHTAVLATIEAAKAYVTVADGDAVPDAADDARPLGRLVLDALVVGTGVPLAVVYERVKKVRPAARDNAIRSTVSQLRQDGVVTTPQRGVYVLQEIPEGYRAQV